MRLSVIQGNKKSNKPKSTNKKQAKKVKASKTKLTTKENALYFNFNINPENIQKGDNVKLNSIGKIDNNKLNPDKVYKVELIKERNLNDLKAFIVYLEKDEGVQNPYLITYFNKVNYE